MVLNELVVKLWQSGFIKNKITKQTTSKNIADMESEVVLFLLEYPKLLEVYNSKGMPGVYNLVGGIIVRSFSKKGMLYRGFVRHERECTEWWQEQACIIEKQYIP